MAMKRIPRPPTSAATNDHAREGMGALDNSKRGVWSTTEAGREMTPEDVSDRHAAYTAQLRNDKGLLITGASPPTRKGRRHETEHPRWT